MPDLDQPAEHNFKEIASKGEPTKSSITASNLPASAQALLSQPSPRRSKQSDTVPIAAIDIILQALHVHGLDTKTSFEKIGLTLGAYNKMKRAGTSRKITEYALWGLLVEHEQKASPNFTQTDLGILFSALTHYLPTRAESYQQEVKDLRKTIAGMMDG